MFNFSIICASIGMRYLRFNLNEVFKSYSGKGESVDIESVGIKYLISQLGFGFLDQLKDATIDNIVAYKHVTPSGIVIYQIDDECNRTVGYIIKFNRPSITALAQLIAHVTMSNGWCQFYVNDTVVGTNLYDNSTWVLDDPATHEVVRGIYNKMIGKPAAVIYDAKLRQAVKELQLAKFLKMIYK